MIPDHVNVQNEIGTSDCALFAMAFAQTLCFIEDPYLTTYVQGKL